MLQFPKALPHSDALAIDVPLELGSIMDSIAVSGDAPLLESASASLSSVIGNRTT